MKASELIEQLRALIEAHGDLPVYAPVYGDEYGDTDEADTPEYRKASPDSWDSALRVPERFYISP